MAVQSSSREDLPEKQEPPSEGAAVRGERIEDAREVQSGSSHMEQVVQNLSPTAAKR
jgi:hypothetical protein